MSDKKQVGHVISHTHWDREWRVPVWHARARLIRMFDSLLNSLEHNPQFKHFLLDGQVVAIEDYLEVCPEQRSRICDLIKQNRIQIGPWYNLPDEYPVCGEALIRNLLIGTRKAQNLGGCLKIAYLSFGWGQTAQFPQILAGFGIDFVYVGKNVSKQRAPHSEFYWRSPDGTSLLSTRLGDEGRANFYFTAIMPAKYGVDYHDPECKIRWGQNGWMWRRAQGAVDLETTFFSDPAYHNTLLNESIQKAIHTTDDTLVNDHRFLGSGTDSTAPYEFIDRLIEEANTLDPSLQLSHSGIEEYAAAVREAIEASKLQLEIVDGELRDGPTFKVSANALAIRTQLKTLNRRAQHLLIRYAEPLASMASMFGGQYPRAFLDKAWQYLLLAHSHDAINGVTLDKTANDTAYKLEQAIELAQVVTDLGAAELIRKIDVSRHNKDDVLIAVFNMSNQEAQYIVHTHIDMPEELNPHWVDIVDGEGNRMAVQPLGSSHIASPVNVVNSRALPFYCDRHEQYFKTGKIPAFGYEVFKAVPHGKLDRKTEFWNNVYDLGSQITGPHRMENEFLAVQINPNGTFDVVHKQTNEKYSGLNYFEDSGDTGDYWQRISPWKNSTQTTLAANAEISLVEDGPLVTAFLIKCRIDIPRHALPKQHKRDDALVPLVIRSIVKLQADTPYVEVETTVVNQAKDHRVRACFPAQIKTDTSVAQGHFNFDSRPICRPRDEQGIRDDGMGTLPLQNFVDLSDDSRGLALLNRNIMEYEVSDDDSRTLFLTLLRCVPVRICTEHRCATQDPTQLGPQCLGEYKFEYAVYPHAGDSCKRNLYGITENYLIKPLVYQFSKHSGTQLSAKAPLLKIKPEQLQIASLKQAQDSEAMILRIYNPFSEAAAGEITFSCQLKCAEITNLNEEVLEKLKIQHNAIRITVDPFKIYTLKCSF